MTGIDWPALQHAARQACRQAYAPYSRFPVGAAALVDDGRTVSGCNVENSSYGVTLCAECGLVSALALSGGGRLVALVCVDATGGPLMPCGRCRQLLSEHAAPGMLVRSADGPIPMSDLLPRAFGTADLDRVANAAPAPAAPGGSATPAGSAAASAGSARPAPVRRPPGTATAAATRTAAPTRTVGPSAGAHPTAVPGPDAPYDPARHPYDHHDDPVSDAAPASPDTFDPEDFQ